MGTRLWHPFSDMASVDGHEFVVDRGEGNWILDEHGRRYLDGCASLWYANLGHGRREIAEAAMAQMTKLESYSCFADIANRPALDLAERLAALAPVDDAKVLFGSGGADAIDTAVKLARGYWQARGEPDRVHVVSRETGYHGTHGYGTSISSASRPTARAGACWPARTPSPRSTTSPGWRRSSPRSDPSGSRRS